MRPEQFAVPARSQGAGAFVAVLVLALVAATLPYGRVAAVWASPVAEAVVAGCVLVAFAAALWRGMPVVLVAPALAAALALLVAGDEATTWFETRFAAPVGRFVTEFLVLFVLGAIFGRAMDESGCAGALAAAVSRRRTRAQAPLAVAGLCAILTLGGVGVFVIAFSVFPIARRIYARERLPIALAPAAIALGAFTATMTAVPGAPSLTNIVAARALGTDAFAAPVPGLLAALVMAVFGGWWLARVAARAPLAESGEAERAGRCPLAHLATLPPAVALATNAGLTWAFGAGALAAPAGAMGPAFYAVVCALLVGIAVALALGERARARATLESGAVAAVGPLLGTAAGVGFGASLAALPSTATLVDALAEATDGDTAVFAAGVAMLYAGLIGSSSGGLLLAFEGETGAMLAEAAAPEAAHRFASLGAGVIDTLPHSGAVIALLAVCGARHAGAYRDIFVVTVIGPALALGVALAL